MLITSGSQRIKEETTAPIRLAHKMRLRGSIGSGTQEVYERREV